MYTIDKLQKMNDYLENDSNESILARYLLNHLDTIDDVTLKKCINDTGVSKSSIHRFFSSGGFDSFKELIDTLSKEMEEDFKDDRIPDIDVSGYCFNTKQINQVCQLIKKADKVYFYGNQKEFEKLQYIIRYLRKTGKMYSVLNTWNIHKVNEKLIGLKPNDLLIIVDTSLRIQDLFEFSINYRNLISFDTIIDSDFKKVFIGDSSTDTFGGVVNIKVERKDEIALNKLDLYMYKQLMKRGI